MKYSKSLRFIVRVHEYETAQVEVSAEASHYDINLDDNELARLSIDERAKAAEYLKRIVANEVQDLARDELERIATWSEIHPNLAEDFLNTPTNLPLAQNHRSEHVSQKVGPSTSDVRRVSRRRGIPTTPSTSGSGKGQPPTSTGRPSVRRGS